MRPSRALERTTGASRSPRCTSRPGTTSPPPRSGPSVGADGGGRRAPVAQRQPAPWGWPIPSPGPCVPAVGVPAAGGVWLIPRPMRAWTSCSARSAAASAWSAATGPSAGPGRRGSHRRTTCGWAPKTDRADLRHRSAGGAPPSTPRIGRHDGPSDHCAAAARARAARRMRAGAVPPGGGHRRNELAAAAVTHRCGDALPRRRAGARRRQCVFSNEEEVARRK